MLAIIRRVEGYKKVFYKIESINGIYPNGVVQFFSVVNLISYLIDLIGEDLYNEYAMLGYEVEARDLIVWFCLHGGEIRTRGEMEASSIAAIIESDGNIKVATEHLKTLRRIIKENEASKITLNGAAVIPISESVVVDQLGDSFKG